MDREGILTKAIELTMGERDDSYGDPRVSMSRLAALWSAYLGVEVTATDAAVCMALLKISRIPSSYGHMDSYVDGSAYLAIAGECNE